MTEELIEKIAEQLYRWDMGLDDTSEISKTLTGPPFYHGASWTFAETALKERAKKLIEIMTNNA